MTPVLPRLNTELYQLSIRFFWGFFSLFQVTLYHLKTPSYELLSKVMKDTREEADLECIGQKISVVASLFMQKR